MPADRHFRAAVGAAVVVLKLLAKARIVLILVVLQPAVYASIALLLLRRGGHADTFGAALGAGLMGVWTSMLFFAGGSLERERRQGTLELLVACPTPLLPIAVGIGMATVLIGLYALVTSIAVAVLLFDVPLSIAEPGLFVLAMLMTVISLGLLGSLLCTLFVLHRQAGLFQNMLEYPVWILSGLLVPTTALPSPLRPLGWPLAPTWAMEALRRAASGSGSMLVPLLMCALLGLCYLAAGQGCLWWLERLARSRATLPLS